MRTSTRKAEKAATLGRRVLLSATLMGCSFALVGCPPQSDELDPENSLTVGLLLPFTGASAATATNFEKAVLMAAERVNEAGGIQGKSLRIVARDTHSEVERSIDSAEELIDEGAVAIIGPESPEIAEAIRTRLDAAEVPLVSPLIGAGSEAIFDCAFPWYRLAPSAHALGENLANDLRADGISEIAILYGVGEYNTAFASAVRNKFESNVLGGAVLIERSLDEGASSYTEEIEEVLAERPEAIVLSTSPQMGAVVFTEANLLGAAGAGWGLSPLLKTPLFLQNINANDVEGALGVAPKIFHAGDDFPTQFADRWLGDAPLEGAYFYYDAVNLLTVALGLLDDVDDFSHTDLTAAIVQASSAQGVSVDWDEIDRGLSRMEDGIDVHYSGLTGPILLQTCGNRRVGVTQAWTIADGKIEEVD